MIFRLRKLLKVAQGDVILLFIESDLGSWFWHLLAMVPSSIKWGQCQWPRLLGRCNAVVNVTGLSIAPDTLVISEWLPLPLFNVKLGNVAAQEAHGPSSHNLVQQQRLTSDH